MNELFNWLISLYIPYSPLKDISLLTPAPPHPAADMLCFFQNIVRRSQAITQHGR